MMIIKLCLILQISIFANRINTLKLYLYDTYLNKKIFEKMSNVDLENFHLT